jgi:hypothetical protein
VQAYVVHCTFQRHHTPGKRARLREEGLWLADPPSYFQADRLLHYGNDVREYVAALEAAASTPVPSLFKHFHAMSYQLTALRDAFAMAQALNRTLVNALQSCMNLCPLMPHKRRLATKLIADAHVVLTLSADANRLQ